MNKNLTKCFSNRALQLSVLAALLLLANQTLANNAIIRINIASEITTNKHAFLSNKHHYFKNLLILALEKTATKKNTFQLINGAKAMSQVRALEEVQHNNLDVYWSMTSIEREKNSYPVRVPLLKGLLGHRIFFIRKGEQYRFDNIHHLQALSLLVAGQGVHWPDYEILRDNGLQVIGGTAFKGLFNMLQHKRFDYFPRGVSEIWQEQAFHSDKNLVIEQNILLHYQSPMYFFVSNEKLQDRIERGLRLAIKDGSFNQLLYNHPSIRDFLNNVDLQKRRIFKLRNKLTKESREILKERALWHQPGDEKS